MPFYEYQCKACGGQVEVLQKISDPPLKKCPECGKSRLTKLVSAPVFRLKGGGWYETDFKSDKDNRRNLVEAEKSGEDKADAKPAEKAPEKAADKPEKPAAAADKGEGKATGKASPARKSAPVRKSAGARKPAGKATRK